MRKRRQNFRKADEAWGLAQLGVIEEHEFEHRLEVAGVQVIDRGSFEDAPDEVLCALFASGVTEGTKAYFASLIVARGLTTCGCEHCQAVEAYAKEFNDLRESEQ